MSSHIVRSWIALSYVTLITLAISASPASASPQTWEIPGQAINFSRDSELLIYTVSPATIAIWSIKRHAPLALRIDMKKAGLDCDRVSMTAFSDDGRQLLVFYLKDNIASRAAWFEISSGRLLKSCDYGNAMWKSCDLSRDGRLVIAENSSGYVAIIDLHTDNVMRTFMPPRPDYAKCIVGAYSQHVGLLVTSSEYVAPQPSGPWIPMQGIDLWNADTGARLFRLYREQALADPQAFQFSPDGTRWACVFQRVAPAKELVRFVEVRDKKGDLLAHVELPRGTARIGEVTFADDNKRLLLWADPLIAVDLVAKRTTSVANLGFPHRPRRGNVGGELLDGRFSPNGKYGVAFSEVSKTSTLFGG